jgi:hypothetical protein
MPHMPRLLRLLITGNADTVDVQFPQQWKELWRLET